MKNAIRWRPSESARGNGALGLRGIIYGVLVLLAVGASGCQVMGQRTIASPYSSDKQAAEILKFVPKGTSRDEAIRLLEKAGIDGSFGASQSTYYCEVWHRPDGKNWALDVAMLFDDEGKLYDTCRAQTDVDIDFAHPARTVATAERTGPPSSESKLAPQSPNTKK